MTTLYQNKRTIKKNIRESIELVSRINSLNSYASVQQKGNIYILTPIELDRIYEIAFLKIFTSWEVFLEDSFIALLCGTKNRKIKPKLIVKKINEDKAYDLLKGVKEYPDWTNIAKVIEMSELYFVSQNPLKIPLESFRSTFNEMKTVRNAISHISKEATKKLNNLAINKLKNYSPPITPGGFLSCKSPNNVDSYIIYYAKSMRIIIDQIIP